MNVHITPELDARFRAAALAEGLVDVRFDLVDSPVGELFVAATDRGLCRIGYTPDRAEEEVARTFGRRLLRTPLDDIRRELDEYFAGRRRAFDLPVDLRVAPFHESVLHELARVPYGETTTYGTLAARSSATRAGSTGSGRCWRSRASTSSRPRAWPSPGVPPRRTRARRAGRPM